MELTHRLKNSDSDSICEVQAPGRRANRDPQGALAALLQPVVRKSAALWTKDQGISRPVMRIGVDAGRLGAE